MYLVHTVSSSTTIDLVDTSLHSFVRSSINSKGPGSVVLLEAIACGCPIVSTDCPGAREVLASGAVGLIAKMGDAVDLSKRMLEILDVSPDRRSLMARSQEFSVERVGQAYLELLASIISHQEPKTGRRWTNLPSARGMD